MSESTVPPGWINAKLFNENYARFPSEEILRHAGEYIAWNKDATRILASAKTMDELEAKIEVIGINWGETVAEFIDPPEITGRL
jgi:hypothetical protein